MKIANYANKPWLSVEVITKGDSRFVKIYSRIHQRKEVTAPVSYSLDFSIGDILKDSNFLNEVRRFF